MKGRLGKQVTFRSVKRGTNSWTRAADRWEKRLNVEELRTCHRCGYETADVVSKCPKCGRGLLSTKQVRRLGWVQVFLGVFLAGFIAIIPYNIAPTMLEPDVPDANGSRFTGTWEQGRMVLALLGLIVVFGLTSFVNGVWQIATGRRNKGFSTSGLEFSFSSLRWCGRWRTCSPSRKSGSS